MSDAELISSSSRLPLGASHLGKVVTSAARPRFLTSNLTVEGLRPSVKNFVEEYQKICRPEKVYVCDGSVEENEALCKKLQEDGRLTKLTKYENCYLAYTTPADVARVEKQTYVCTERKEDAVPTPKEGVESKLGNWKSPAEMDAEMSEKFNGCMQGRTMYVIPFSMGPVGSPFSKIGIQLTDSEYVVASMRIMTRMGQRVLDSLGDNTFVRCLHSVGKPLEPGEQDAKWPCNPKKLAIAQYPERSEIKSFGSGYGGNSLLGKKCLALRIASCLARDEGWLAEHMLILGITNPQGKKYYIAAAFPSACGKTNLAMINPTVPGWKAECIGDDIAWMRFDKEGRLRAINPEYGFFGVAPGTNSKSNPNAMASIFKNTIFTNVARTSDGGVFWEGLENELEDGVSVTTWRSMEHWERLSKEEKKKTSAAHPNSRFCSPTGQCPIIDPRWEDPEGVPIDAILFGGRRPKTIPLVYESFDWTHGVFVGASMRSEATAASTDFKKGDILNDPFAMRPFFGYNVTDYMLHWLSLEQPPGRHLPKVFHVNWFRKNEKGFIWPGFGENCRVLEWILRRCEGEDIADESPLGLIPKPGTINTEGLGEVDMEALFRMPKDELEQEVGDLEKYFDSQLPGQLPSAIAEQLEAFKARIAKL